VLNKYLAISHTTDNGQSLLSTLANIIAGFLLKRVVNKVAQF